MTRVQLLIIDPQNDFISMSTSHSSYIAMQALSSFIDNGMKYIQNVMVSCRIVTTIHHVMFPYFWKVNTGGLPYFERAYQKIYRKDIEKYGMYIDSSWEEDCIYNLFEALNGLPLILYPSRAMFGTEGIKIFEPLSHSLSKWSSEYSRDVDFFIRHLCPLTLEYGIFGTRTIVEGYPQATPFNYSVSSRLTRNRGSLMIAGSSLDGTIEGTLSQIMGMIPMFDSVTVLEDCIALPNDIEGVISFSESWQSGKKRAAKDGIRFLSSKDVLRELGEVG